MHPFLPELVRVLRQHREQRLTTEVEAHVLQMSPATLDRLLRPSKQTGGRRHCTTTKPGSLLKRAIPIRTFGDWQESRPGFLEVDRVAPCGESTEGFYLNTLSAAAARAHGVDVATGWVERQGV